MTASWTQRPGVRGLSKGDASKQDRALKLIQRADFGLSAQVLQEFYVTMTRKLKTPMAPEMAVALMDEYRAFPMAPHGLSTDRFRGRDLGQARNLLLGWRDHRVGRNPPGQSPLH
ncbi:MAG: hypothetical protein ABIP62_07240 [Vicinamibacteria bacterium]